MGEKCPYGDSEANTTALLPSYLPARAAKFILKVSRFVAKGSLKACDTSQSHKRSSNLLGESDRVSSRLIRTSTTTGNERIFLGSGMSSESPSAVVENQVSANNPNISKSAFISKAKIAAQARRVQTIQHGASRRSRRCLKPPCMCFHLVSVSRRLRP